MWVFFQLHQIGGGVDIVQDAGVVDIEKNRGQRVDEPGRASIAAQREKPIEGTAAKDDRMAAPTTVTKHCACGL